MDERSKAVASDGWLERALARWEWEGGHIAPRAERHARPDVENRIPIYAEAAASTPAALRA